MKTANLQHLQTTLSHVDSLIRTAVEYVQETGQNPGDALRGLVVSHDEVQLHLNTPPMQGLWAENTDVPLSFNTETNTELPFLRLVQEFGLSIIDAYILLICITPELDKRYERVYAFLQDDMSQRRATVNLVMNLLGGTLEQRFEIWERLKPAMPLAQFRLVNNKVNTDKPNAAGLSNVLWIDDRLVAHLLGDDSPDTRLLSAIINLPTDRSTPLNEQTFNYLCGQVANSPMVYMKGRRELGQQATARMLCEPYQLPIIGFDGEELKASQLPFADVWRLMIREAYLNRAALYIEGWEHLLNDNRQPDSDLWQAIYEYPRPVFLCGEKEWEPLDPNRSRRMLRAEFNLPEYEERYTAWQEFTRYHDIDVPSELIEELSNKFRLPRLHIARAVTSAVDIAVSRQSEVELRDLYAGAQAHISLNLQNLAERITPKFTWDDLILPPDELRQLHEITERARHANRVQNEWGFIKRISNASGVSALFSGESGTGKTLSVQVIANDLGLALYRIDLSAVVSKYIGETEKNLNKIFTEARTSNAILFFDEADAIFGKRSEVKDARDRYANIEIAYLLQQIEDYDGIAIMATNLRQNLDEAFTRRIDFLVDFPFPDEDYRLKLWNAHFPPTAPIDPDIDLEYMASRYHLAGGNIRNAALASAYLAAADGGIITENHIRMAIRREHQKMGRLVEEF